MAENHHTVKNRVRELRSYTPMTQGELAEKLGISRTAMGCIERNQTEWLTYDMMYKLMAIFELSSFDELLVREKVS